MKTNNCKKTMIEALRETLKEVPFLELMSESKAKDGEDSNSRIDLRIQNEAQAILVEYKSSGQPRLAREATLQIKDWIRNGLGTYGVFTAPYISPEAAKICKENGIGYLDLAGNCLLSFGTVYIYREGKPNPSIERRELRSLYSAKAERILRVLLTGPKREWKTETLAEAAQVSYGQIANVKKILTDREWIEIKKNGIKLEKPEMVLDGWAKQYRFRRNQVFGYYALAEVAECEYLLAEACKQVGIRYALTAFSGAARIAPVVRYQRAIAYVDGNLDALLVGLGWKRVESGENVSLLVPYDEGVFFDRREVDGIQVATPVQIYLDLMNYHGRGEEAAQAIRKVIEQTW
ncbi:MAG: type IV toxin-antitoxin system AbiEi family antitoxin [Anaerolineales bacterium]|jgi:hypothetical protein